MKAYICIVLLFSLCGQVTSQNDVDMVCPSSVQPFGDMITLSCIVSATKFPTQCVTNFQNEVSFRRSDDRTSFAANCTVSSATPCTVTSVSPGTCGCVSSNSTNYVYQYTFEALKDYEGFWDCNIPCSNGFATLLTYNSNPDCDNVKFMEKIVIPKNYELAMGLGLGIPLGVLFILCVIVGILVCCGVLKIVKKPSPEKTGTYNFPCCISGPPAAAHDPKNSTTNSDHEPTPDYEKDAKKTGHKATGRPHNGVADEDV